MSQINLQINFNPRVIVSLVVVALIGTLAYKIPETKAQSSAITGKFGCILNTNPLPYMTAKTNTTAFINQMSIIDFDTRTINATISNVLRFNSMTASNNNDEATASFSINSGPFSGAYTLSPSGGGMYVLVPVNAGNTLLIKTKEDGAVIPETGVCQKI